MYRPNNYERLWRKQMTDLVMIENNAGLTRLTRVSGGVVTSRMNMDVNDQSITSRTDVVDTIEYYRESNNDTLEYVLEQYEQGNTVVVEQGEWEKLYSDPVGCLSKRDVIVKYRTKLYHIEEFDPKDVVGNISEVVPKIVTKTIYEKV